jgi:hypothetical protein
MRIQGKEIDRVARTISIHGVELVVTSLPIGLEREFIKIYPEPAPPVTEISRVGKPPERVTNWEDAKYIADYKEWQFHKNMYTFWKVTKNTPGIEFTNLPVNMESMKALSDEIRSSGLSEGDISTVFGIVHELTQITVDEIDETKKNS